MEILSKEFNVKRLAIVGGGNINGSFLGEGLIDEVSILIGPGIDGRKGMAAVFDGLPMEQDVIQLEKLDFTGKIVRVFTTHEGSGTGSIPAQVKKTCKGANVIDDAIAIRGTAVKTSKGKIENWI